MISLKSTITVTALALLLAGTTTARAQCPHQGLVSFGPISAATFGYPAYYVDHNNLALGTCLDPNNLLCGLPPLPNPAAPIDIATGNFFSEHLYTFVTATVPMPGGGQGLLVLSVVGTFGTPLGDIIPGDQVVFSRIRFRIDTPAAGTYTLTHPFGVHTLTAAAPGRRSINFTDDCILSVPPTCGPAGLNAFTTPLEPFSYISNWITWDATLPAPPVGHIGDPALLHTVTGSPCGTNLFRVEGPGLPPGGVETSLFSVLGKRAEICGNGFLDPMEQCDDGNTLNGDCCSATCQFEPAAQACDDGNVCTTNSTCDGAGLCQVVANVPGVCQDGNACTTADVCAAGVCVGGPPPACPTTAITADVSPKSGSPTTRFGTATTLAVDSSSAKQTFLRFNVAGLGATPVASAKVRLQVANLASAASPSGGRIHAISNCTWNEATMTWNVGRPAIDGGVLSTLGAVARNQVVEFDVTPALNHGDGDYCFAIDSLNADEVDYNSREAAIGKPQLLLTAGGPCGCATPVCGDNAVNQPSEQCDGRTDFACPGLCTPTCTCCTATTCAAQAKNCGTIPDGCGGILTCGTCIAPQTCAGGGVANVCGGGVCLPTTCAAQGATCGTIPDGCGGTLTCGTCIAPQTCGGGGVANACGAPAPPTTSGTNAYQAGVSGPAGSANVDTYIRLSTPTTNNGTLTDVIVGLTNDPTKVNRAIMAFNLAGVPANATVTSCALRVNVLQSSSATPGHVRGLCGAHWLDGDGQGENKATWNEWKGGSTWGAAGAASTAACALGGDYTTAGEVAYTPPTGTGAFTFPDISALCQDAVAAQSGWLRLRLSQDSEATASNLIRFDSSEGSTAANRPRLTVTWTAP